MLWLHTALVLQLCGNGSAVERISQQPPASSGLFIHRSYADGSGWFLLQTFLWRHPSKKHAFSWNHTLWVLINYGKQGGAPLLLLPHFNNTFCGPGFGTRFIVLCFLSFPGYLWAGISLSAHLRAVSFALHLRAAWTQLPVGQRAPGALRLGLLKTLQWFERYKPEKSAVVVALMMR